MSPAQTEKEWKAGPWDLGQLLESGEQGVVQKALSEVEEQVSRLEARRRELDSANAETVLSFVQEYEAISENAHRLAAYGALWFSADTQSEDALAFRNLVHQRLTPMQNRLLFFTLWWKSLDDDEADRLLPDAATHPDQRFFLEEQRRVRDFALDEAGEQLVNLKDADGIGGLLTVYSMLTNRLVFELEVDGEMRQMTRDELMGYVLSSDAGQREAAYREFYSVFEKEVKVLGQIYVHRVRDWYNENVSLRGYESAIDVRNVANDIPSAAVDRLLEVSRRNVGIFQRFFRLKAKWLGQERLQRFDLYAPLATTGEQIAYGDAVDSVLDTFSTFDPGFAAAARTVFDDGHIDSEIRRGKRSGAFCATVLPSLSPWVLVNYAGRPRDVATLAHELGHAVHSVLASGHTVLTQSASLPLAETASVFSEMLVTERLMKECTDPLARRELLSSSVDDIYATVLRQIFFVAFEKQAHEAILGGARLEDLHELYEANLAEQFGDSVEVTKCFRYEWVSIPHIYSTPFYCYAYSFGQLLVLALYRRYQADPEGFKPGYLQLLAHGGSARPQEILAEADVDMTDEQFWQGGFDLVAEMIDDLEAESGNGSG